VRTRYMKSRADVYPIYGKSKVGKGLKQMEKIENTLYNLNKDIPLQLVYLRGSYLGGSYSEGSDIDLIIVTDYLYNISQHVKRKVLLPYFEDISLRVDLLCITSSELKIYSERPIFKLEPVKLIFKGERK